MRNPLTLLTLVVMLLTTATGRVQAQQTADNARIAFRIDGITSEERDAIAEDLTAAGDYRIAFACVPAGILVIEPVPSSAYRRTSTELITGVRSRIGTRNATDEPRSMAELEAVCANTRNQ